MPLSTPKLRTDLKFQPDASEPGRVFVKDPLRHEFFRYNEGQVAMMQCFDGKRTLPEVQALIAEQYEIEVSAASLQKFVDRLEKALLLDVTSYRADDAKTRRAILRQLERRGIALRIKARDGSSPEAQLFEAASRQLHEGDPCHAASYLEAVLETNPHNTRARELLTCIHEAFFRSKIVVPSHVKMLHLWNPDRFLAAIDNKVGNFLFSRLGIALLFVFIATSAFSMVDVLGRPELFASLDWLDIPLVVLVFALHAAVHELSHGVACKHYGGTVDNMGLLLMYGTIPGAYCDVSESYLFEKRRHKMAVQLAGVTGHMVLQAVAWHVTYLTDAAFPLWGPLLAINLYVLYGNLKNLIPLAKFDGYYALSEFLNLPNLHERSFAYLQDRLGVRLLGLPPKHPNVSPRDRRVFLTFGILACVFTALMMYFLFISFLLPKAVAAFGTLGLVLAVGYIGQQIVFKVGVAVVRTVRVIIRSRATVFTRRRLIMLGVITAGVVGVLCLPWPLDVEGKMLVEPSARVMLRADEAGVVDVVHVREGDHVTRGQILAVMRADELVRDRADLVGQLAVTRARVALLQRGARSEELAVARASTNVEQVELTAARGRMWDAMRDRKAGGASSSAVLASAALSASAGGLARDAEHSQAIVEVGARVEDVASAQADVRRLEAALQGVDVRLGYLTIRSTIDGVIVTPHPEDLRGRWLARGTQVLEVHDTSKWRVKVTPDRGESLGSIALGQAIHLRAAGEPNEMMVSKIDTVVAPETSDGVVHLYASGAHATWRSGMTGSARIYLPSRTIAYRALALPMIRLFDFDLWRIR